MTDTNLKALLLADTSKRPAVIRDLEQLIESEVGRKGGVEGVAIKGGYKVVKKVKPGIIPEALDHLLDPFIDRIDPMFQKYSESNDDPKGFPEYLSSRSNEAANLLLGVTDERAQNAQNKVLKKTYGRLRPRAERHVTDAIPGAAKVLGKHL